MKLYYMNKNEYLFFNNVLKLVNITQQLYNKNEYFIQRRFHIYIRKSLFFKVKKI